MQGRRDFESGQVRLTCCCCGSGRVLRRSCSRRGLVHGLPQRRAHLDVAQLVQVALEVDDQIQVAGLLLIELALQNTHKYTYTRTRKSAGGDPQELPLMREEDVSEVTDGRLHAGQLPLLLLQ